MQVSFNDITRVLRDQFDPVSGRQFRQAVSMSINKVLLSNRVMMGRQIRQYYNMNVFDAKSEIVQKLSTTSTLTGTLSGNKGFTPFEYFKINGENNITGQTFKTKRAARYKMVNGKRVVDGRSTSVPGGEGRHATFEVSILRGVSSLFTHAFIANTKYGPMLFNRGSYNSRTNVFGSISRRNPIERLRTLSVYQEITNRKTLGKSEALLRVEYAKELERLLVLQLNNKGNWR